MRAVFSIHQRFCHSASSVVGCARCVAGGAAGERLGCAAGSSTSIQTAATTPMRIASRARRLRARNGDFRGMITDDSVVDGLLASTLADVAWMAGTVNVRPRTAFPDSPLHPDLARKLRTDHGSEIMVLSRV